MNSANTDDQKLAELREAFNGHRIWRSVRSDGRLGDWVATLHDPAVGVDPTVIGSTAAELHDALIREGGRARVKRQGW
ncbi:hypothetical protein Acsp03_19290 [Actinomadura sp. NBRC 104412]|uniref:hypothetical protein n=1 Tax=Actinomadura sp. NBRC 104412 TaxID=3032203 RepID=UPI0024A40F3E|nr:hypothetical protein [Actinomadura sp. NBRC 104412]GLZ04463.1 hypothetical protein Acsp03_19290 [Actinomadura sp. NBRC 104412]